jgi:hypothetical protein
MTEVFNRFKDLFEKRYSLIPVSKLGEDSVRYDFFLALKEVKNLEPWQIQVEYSLNTESFIPRNHPKSKRGENPQVDLWVNERNLKLCSEFGFFRRNSNKEGSISVTENVLKMLNDFMRMALHSRESNSESYFICVADEKMLETSMTKYKDFKQFPAQEYQFDWDVANKIVSLYKSAKKIDSRFLLKMKELKLRITAEKIVDKEIFSEINTFKTKILVWRVTSQTVE